MPAEVVGVDQLIAGLRQAERELAGGRHARDAGDEIRKAARRHVPVESGVLRASGRVVAQSDGALVRFGGPAIPWAGPADRGDLQRPQGGFIRGSRYMEKGADRAEPAVVDIYEQATHDALRRSGLT